jgi:rod shape-determining protein MreC
VAFGLSSSKSGRRSNRGAVILGVFVFAMVGALIAQTAPQVRQILNPVRTTLGDRLGQDEEIGLWARVTGQAARERRVRELEREVRDLARYKSAAISMAERLEAYEDILNLVGEPPVRGVTARVTAESDGPFALTLLANAGRAQGVEAGSVAVNEGGLVGRVILLGQRSSRILLVTDYNSRVPVVGEVSGLRGILRGGNNGLGVLVDLPEVADFAEGERVLTSGEGGAFPRGLVVGEARKISDEWRVRYGMNTGRGGYVQIVPPPLIEKPLPVADLPRVPGQTAPPVAFTPPARPTIAASAPAAIPAPRPRAPRPQAARPQPVPAADATPPAVFVTPAPLPEPLAQPAAPPPVEPAPAVPTGPPD